MNKSEVTTFLIAAVVFLLVGMFVIRPAIQSTHEAFDSFGEQMVERSGAGLEFGE